MAEASLIPEVRITVPSKADDSRVPMLNPAPADTLRSARILGDADMWGIVSSMRVSGGHLFVTDRVADPMVTVLDWKSGEVVDRFGRRGEGPGEFLDPSWVTHSPRDDGVWIFDYPSRRFTRMRRGDAGPAYLLEEEIRLLGPLTPFHPVWSGEGILTTGFFPDHTLLHLDPRGRPVRWVTAELPVTPDRVANVMGRGRLNRTRMATDPRLTRIALAYQSANRIDLFDMRGGLIRTIQGPSRVMVRYRTGVDGAGNPNFRWESDNEWAYVDVDASDRYVYALFCGGTCPERDTLPTRVHVFSWSGEFVTEFALDHPVKAITVNSDDSRLFGYSEDPVPAVKVWNLEDLAVGSTDDTVRAHEGTGAGGG